MRKALIIFAAVVVIAVGAMLAGGASGATTAPNVTVTFLGLTNGGVGSQDARFQVLNRGGGRIRVLEVGIQGCEPFESLSLPGSILAKPVTIPPGIAQEVRTPFVPNAPRWRGVVTVNRDTPRQRFRTWLLAQSWRSYLPRKWIPDLSGRYIFSSPWEILNQSPAANSRRANLQVRTGISSAFGKTNQRPAVKNGWSPRGVPIF